MNRLALAACSLLLLGASGPGGGEAPTCTPEAPPQNAPARPGEDRDPAVVLGKISEMLSEAEARVRDGGSLPGDGRRVVFLGDSITNAGLYVQDLDAFLLAHFPGSKVELINLGLPSETVSGLSEPAHPFPRPDVHERLGRVLERTKPDVVVACYGMNDGIYSPFDEGRFARYQRGIRRLIDRVKQAGAEIVLVTPPPFDARPIRRNLRPAGAESYSWAAPYVDYDQTLERYAAWVWSLRREGIRVANARAPILDVLEESRKHDPDFTLAADGIHLNAWGHRIIAKALLRAWDGPGDFDGAVIDAAAPEILRGTITDLTRDGDALRFTWTTPLHLPPTHDLPPWWVDKTRGRYRILSIVGLPHPRYELSEGEHRLATGDRKGFEWFDLGPITFPDLTPNRRAVELHELVAKRERLLTPAWLSAVGHKRPGVAAGLPLEEARRQAAELEVKARQVARPVALSLKLEPADR